MVDTVRSTAALVGIITDGGSNTAQDVRDLIVSAGRSAIDVFVGKSHTFSDAPHISYPGNTIIDGISVTRVLTQPEGVNPAAAGLFNVVHSVGWRAVDITGSTLTIKFDFGVNVKAEVVQAIITGVVDVPNAIYHPAAVKIEYSDDDSNYTVFGTALTGLNDDPITTSYWACIFNAAPQAARYWRWSLDEPSPGAGDNWIMLRRVQSFGRLIS